MIKYSLINMLMEASYYISVPSVDIDTVLNTDSFPPALQREKHPTHTTQAKPEIPKRWLHDATDGGVCCEINSERVFVSKAYIFLILFSSK